VPSTAFTLVRPLSPMGSASSGVDAPLGAGVEYMGSMAVSPTYATVVALPDAVYSPKRCDVCRCFLFHHKNASTPMMASSTSTAIMAPATAPPLDDGDDAAIVVVGAIDNLVRVVTVTPDTDVAMIDGDDVGNTGTGVGGNVIIDVEAI
jgi:hypothetical protein